MSEATRVRDLLDLPDTLGKADYVLQLTQGVEKPRETVESYVVTPAIVDAFDRALALVGRALRDGRSQATYLHGSYGSGKSHFMAVLSLLLRGHELAWREPQLHDLRAKHPFVGNKNLLELHFHMIGKQGLEDALFSGYVDHVRQHHPEAPLPALFADEQLFDDARRLLDELGDDAFFAPMNEGIEEEDDWGEFGDKRWTRDRFETFASSTDPDERGQLFTALVDTRFGAYTKERGVFVDAEAGLSEIARHAKTLGYDAILLFLDELVLWLSMRAADAGWVHREVEKMVKLVESQDASRSLPIVSFIARQRSLVEMVGEQYVGSEAMRLDQQLKHWEGRFDTIHLEDRNLPDIIEKRILKPKDDGSRSALDAAFDKLRKTAGNSWDTLLGREDAEAFRKTYPFSPALVDALVALSSFLQRDRTAIKLLMEILVEHIEDLRVGEVVRVGDLFDPLAGGEEAADGAMRSRFATAKELYKHKFLPLIQESNGTNSAERCQRLRPDHLTRIGCSNCPEKACRSDNRLIKTLLIGALVPQVKAFQNLTASRLVQLNHGTLQVPIPGTEAGIVAQKLKRWATEIPQLRVGEQKDPTVRVQLEGVDVTPILEAASGADERGARQRIIKELLFEALGITKAGPEEWGTDDKRSWRCTQRPGHIRFGNVRQMSVEALRCPPEHDWRLVVDYPFDDETHGPNDDVQRLDTFVEETGGTWTLVWLPHFFSDATKKHLRDLVILEHILSTKDTERRYLSHLAVDNQQRARLDLDNLRNQKRNHLGRVLEQAYGLAKAESDTLDPSATVDDQLRVLQPGARVRQQLAPTLAYALDNYIPALLEARYPRHPIFTETLSSQRIERLVELFGELVDSEDKRLARDKKVVDEVRGTLGELGLVRTTEGTIHLMEEQTLEQLDRKRAQQGDTDPTVGQIRSFIDESGTMGLLPAAEDLVVRCYARWAKRTFVSLGKPYTPQGKSRIPDEVVLEKPDLPTHEEWARAYSQAGAYFGVGAAGRALHPDNLKRFEAHLREKREAHARAVAELPGLLVRRLETLELDPDADRLKTARSADSLVAELSDKSAVDQVRVLARFEPETSARAIGKSIASSAEVVAVLKDDLLFNVFRQLRTRRADLTGADELLENVARALRQDELNEALTGRLRDLARAGQDLLMPSAPAPEPEVPGREKAYAATLSRGARSARDELTQALAELDRAIESHGDSVEVEGSVRIYVKR